MKTVGMWAGHEDDKEKDAEGLIDDLYGGKDQLRAPLRRPRHGGVSHLKICKDPNNIEVSLVDLTKVLFGRPLGA